MAKNEFEAALLEEVAKIVNSRPEHIDPSRSLSELGVDSVGYCNVASFIQQRFGVKVKPEQLFELPSVAATAEFVQRHHAATRSEAAIQSRRGLSRLTSPAREACGPLEDQDTESRDVAIVGLSIRVPGAESFEQYEELIASGRCMLTDFPLQRSRGPLAAGGKVPSSFKGGFVADAQSFDASFFNISPREAVAMDPQQRLLMESAWDAFSDAGYPVAELSGTDTSVYVGISSFEYFELLLRASAVRSTHIGTGVSHSVAANRISQFFNLKGASEAVDTACSSSLVALGRAVEALRQRQCGLALVAGVNVLASEFGFQIFSDAGMLSPEGACRPFDQRANGYVRGEGVVSLVLKRADTAKRDGDRIWAVIKGAAVAHSGRTNSLTAPNPQAQAEVIVRAVEDAGGIAAPIAYVEAHGTGTPLGDPVELRGLARAFEHLQAAGVVSRGVTRIGSVKAQIGHLEAAAGLAGVAKALVTLSSGQLPGSSYLNELNPKIDLSEGSFEISADARPLRVHTDATPGLMRASVSAFGFGGSNAHVLLEQAPEIGARSPVPTEARVFLVSAKTSRQLTARCAQLSAYLERRVFQDAQQEQVWLQDVAYSLARQTPFTCRRAIVAATAQQLAAALDQYVRAQHDAASSTRLNALATANVADESGGQRTRLLTRLAERWEAGHDLDYAGLAPRGAARLVTLPGYPFSRIEFWPQLNGAASISLPHAATPTAVSAHVPAWSLAPLEPTATTSEGVLLVLVAGDQGRAVAEALAAQRAVRTVRLGGSRALPDAASVAAGNEADSDVTQVLDLTALDAADRQSASEVAWGLGTLSVLLSKHLRTGKPVSVIQFTVGVQRLPGDTGRSSLAGALASGVFKHLGAEYRRCQSRTVDLQPQTFEPSTIAVLALSELASVAQDTKSASECAYRDGQRYTCTLQPIELETADRETSSAACAALITGGTGAIGFAIAEDLVARGVKALVLTGRRALSERQLASVERLRSGGIQVEVFLGELADPALAFCLERVRREVGPLTHVFHCAGTVDRATPAFFQKSPESMERVLAPKCDGVWALHDLLKDVPPAHCVLFSSLSAVHAPAAVGVLDYATANRFLDLFATHQQALGHGYYRSIQWGRWQGMGLAANPARGLSVNANDLQDLGPQALGLTASQHLAALWSVLEDQRCASGVLLATRAELDAERRVEVHTAAPTVSALSVVQSDPGTLASVRALVAAELEQTQAALDDHASFEALGIDSIVLTGLVTKLEALIGRSLDPETLIARNSIAAVADYLSELGGVTSVAGPFVSPLEAVAVSTLSVQADETQARVAVQSVEAPARGHFPIAVIGLSCRFPGAPNKQAFWDNLAGAVDSVGPVPFSRWNAVSAANGTSEVRALPRQWGGFLDDIEGVYPKLFGMSPKEAADVDPLIRLFTECGLETAADAGYDAAALRGKRVGVFVGARTSRYAERIQVPGKHSAAAVGQNFVAAYTSHLLDLRGPSLVVDSACSSSLAALHLACQSLRVGDSELALAGGVEVLLDEKLYQFLTAAGALSPDGRCRTFDAQANGFVPGEGVGAVLLKPLHAAQRDGDAIYAVIEGSAMNNDGHTLGVTTPGCDGQVDVIQRALANAELPPRAVSYVETHGTGTLIGDPIELRALTRAFEADPPKRCPVGSVKTNIGHLLSAAGIASFIKVALSLHHRMLPPTLNCERVNPRFGFEATPFFPLLQAEPWLPEGGRRVAGVSAFGFGKTNVHMVMGERPETSAAPNMAQVASDTLHGRAASDRVYAWHDAFHPALASQPTHFLDIEDLSIGDLPFGEEAAE